MQKTKLGITIGLMGATLYFLGLMSFFGLLILAGYVMLFESNEWLKRSAVKAVAVVISFTLLSIIVSFGREIFDFINDMFALFRLSVQFNWPLQLVSMIDTVINVLEKLVLLALGFKAVTQGSMAVGPIDKIIDKNM